MTDRRPGSKRPPFDNFDADSFVGDVLGRTSGGACDRAAAQLEDLMANRLGGMDRQLVQAHLEHCAACRDLAVTVGWLRPLLPEMAEIEPGPDFLSGVMARTARLRRPLPADGRPRGAAGLMDRLGRWWEGRIQRPQFALQAAYVATVVLVLLTALPVSPLRQLPGRALAVVTAGPGGAPLVGPAVVRASDWVDEQGAAVVNGGRARVESRWTRWRDDLSVRTARTATSRQELTGHWRKLLTESRARNLGGAGYEVLAALHTGQAIWRQWWQIPETNVER